MELTNRELSNRKTLAEKKPIAFAKIQRHPSMILEKKSVALIQMQYNYKCNFKCKHCAIERFKDKTRSTLTLDNVKKIANEAHDMGLASICISGGEPLIFKDLDNVVEAIDSSRFVISMDTNGYLLTDEKVRHLVDIGVDRIHLSIDGLEDNHDKFRNKKNSWSRTINALEYTKKYGLGVIVNIVATKSLLKNGELLRQLEYIKQFGEHASIIYAKPVGAFENDREEILDHDDIVYIQTLTKQYNCSTHLSLNCGYDFGCLCFKRHFSITAYGDVLPCPWIPISMGNVLMEPLDVIVDRGLSYQWFSYNSRHSCLSGDRTSEFYNKILTQLSSHAEYPVHYSKIKWDA